MMLSVKQGVGNKLVLRLSKYDNYKEKKQLRLQRKKDSYDYKEIKTATNVKNESH